MSFIRNNAYAPISIVLLIIPFVAAVNFDTCLAEVQTGKFGQFGGTDNRGRPVNITQATAITYDLCLTACGSGPEPFQWAIFSQQFSSWLLPWLALISQLPFGANDKLDNLESTLLSVGSPALAAYSLALTVLNGRWIAQLFSRYRYPNTRHAIRVLTNLQYAPLRISAKKNLLASLVVLPQNDKWWKVLDKKLDFNYTWSIAAVASIFWVIIAFVFTAADSFTGDITSSINANGQGVGSIWLWLVPIVVGWLQLSPKCDSILLQKAVKEANKLAYVAVQKGRPVKATRKSEHRALSLDFSNVDGIHRDELCSSPIYNYARFLPWVQAVEDVSEAFCAASDQCYNHKPVNHEVNWVMEHGKKFLNSANRVGDSRQVKEYCYPLYRNDRTRSRWGSNAFSRMLIASSLAILLQWGTTGAAIVVNFFTPTRGLGCRSGSYLLYGVLATISWILMVISSILTHAVSTKPREYREYPGVSRGSHRIISSWSICLRRLGKFIAIMNAIWIIISCMFQFSNFFDRCFCNSSVFSLGKNAYNVIEIVSGDVVGVRDAWIGGLGLAGASATIFWAFIYLFIDPQLPEE